MTYFINKKLYTDIQSYQVLDINEETNEATVVEVVKQPLNLQFADDGTCLNNNAAFNHNNIVVKEGAQPFKIYRRKDGKWYKKNNSGWSIDKRLTTYKNLEENLKENETIVEDEYCYHVLKTTKTGKLRTHYTYFGEMSEKCNYFYDYNF